MTLPGPRDYVELPYRMPSDWRVLDIGPGSFPLKRADVYLDWNAETLAPLAAEGKETILADLSAGLSQIPDRAFNFVWCSHVFEHLDDPAAAAAELSRIASAGILVVPSAIKESLFDFEEPDHKWLILPHPQEGPPIFIRHNAPYMRHLKDQDLQKILCRLFRHGTYHNHDDDKYMREWFRNHEADLDIVVRWGGTLELQVIG